MHDDIETLYQIAAEDGIAAIRELDGAEDRLRRDLAERSLAAARQYLERCTPEFRKSAERSVRQRERALKAMTR